MSPELKSSSQGSLLDCLKIQYKDRWPVVLDSLFSVSSAQRIALKNAHITSEHKTRPLFQKGPLAVFELNEGESFSRQNGLLTCFCTTLASVLPVAVLPAATHKSILVLGHLPSGRLLALAQLAFAEENSAAMKSQHSTTPQSISGEQQSARLRKTQSGPKLRRTQSAYSPGSTASEAGNTPQAAAQKKRRNSSKTPGESRDYSLEGKEDGPEWQLALPWSVYGEGSEPKGWHQRDSDSTQTQTSAHRRAPSPLQQEQPWTYIGSFLEGLIHRSVRAGCCTVKTSSGDWAELAEQAMQTQLARQSALNSRTACTTSGCLSSNEAIETGLPLEEGNRDSKGNGAILDCVLPNEESKAEFQLLLQNHIPAEARDFIRLQLLGKDQPWKEVRPSCSYEQVIVDVRASATQEAVLRACQMGSKAAWPSEADAARIAGQAKMLAAGLEALKPGGHLLFCSSSLAQEETDDLVWSEAQHCAQILPHPAAESREAAELLRVSLKKLGVERTRCGWRMLPDLSFQGPQYFSLLRKL